MKLEFSYSKLTLALVMACGLSSALAETPNRVYLDSTTKFLPQLQQNAEQIWPGLSSINHLPIVAAADDALYTFRFQPKNPAEWQPIFINGQQVYYKSQGGFEFSVKLFDSNVWTKGDFSFEGQPIVAAHAYLPDFSQLKDVEIREILVQANMELAAMYFLDYELAYSPYAQAKRAQLWQHDTGYDAFNQKDLLALLILQKELMTDYLKNKDVNTLKDYVAVFLTRYAMLNQNAKAKEVNVLGVVNPWYASMQAVVGSKQAQAELLDSLEGYDLLDPSDLDGMYQSTESTLFTLSTAVEFALDDLKIDWKNTVEKTSQAPTLFLADYFHMAHAEVSSRFEAAKQRKNFQAIVQHVNAAMDPYLQTMQQNWQAYQQDSGVELLFMVKNPEGFEREGSLNHYPRDSLTDLYVNAHPGTKSLYSYVHNYYLLSVGNFDRLVEYYDQNHIVEDDILDTVSIKFPANSQVDIDGKQMTLAQLLSSGKTWTFTKLSVTQGDKVATFEGYQSKLSVVQGKVHIEPTIAKTLGLSKKAHTPKQTVSKLLHRFKLAH